MPGWADADMPQSSVLSQFDIGTPWEHGTVDAMRNTIMYPRLGHMLVPDGQ